MNRYLSLALFVALFPATLPAQEVALTLNAAVERALQVAPSLRRLEALDRSAEAAARGARAARWPSVNASATYTRNSDVPELTTTLPGGQSLTLYPNIPNAYTTRVQAGVPLFTGGRIRSTVRVADRNREGTAWEQTAGKDDLVLETTAAYWALATTSENERVLAEALNAYEAHLKDTRNRMKVGMAAKNTLLAVQVSRDEAELLLISARNARATARANLLRLLDFSESTTLALTDRLDARPNPLPSTEELTKRALDSRPERLALQSRLEAAEEGVRIQKAGWWPQLTASGGYDYSRPNRKIFPMEDGFKGTWDVGLQLTMNLFEGGKTVAAVDQAKAQAEALRQQLVDVDRRIRLEITALHLNLEAAWAAVPVAERNVEAGRENLSVSKDRYRAGLIPSSELLDAETALLRAGLSNTEVLARLKVAEAELTRALGGEGWKTPSKSAS